MRAVRLFALRFAPAAFLFAADVTGVAPGEAMLIDSRTAGCPYPRLGELPPGDFWVQALVHVRSAGPQE